MAHGAKGQRARFCEKVAGHYWDSTFFHSGMTGLATASYNKSNITVLIVDNSTTGMTGHQDNPATGKTLKGAIHGAAVAGKRMPGVGCSAYPRGGFAKYRRPAGRDSSVAKWRDGVSVVIARRPCVMIVKGQKNSLQINAEKCIGSCCLKTGCPALQRKGNKVTIDQTMCNACGLCAGLCPKNNAWKGVEMK